MYSIQVYKLRFSYIFGGSEDNEEYYIYLVRLCWFEFLIQKGFLVNQSIVWEVKHQASLDI